MAHKALSPAAHSGGKEGIPPEITTNIHDKAPAAIWFYTLVFQSVVPHLQRSPG